MIYVSDSLYGMENFLGISRQHGKKSNALDEACGSLDLDLGDALETFSLREVVSAVISFLEESYTKVKFKLTSLCGEAFSMAGDKLQLQTVLRNAVAVLEKSFYGARGIIDVFVHELKRPSDGLFLLQSLFREPKTEEILRSTEDSDSSKEIRSQFLAVSLKKTFEAFDSLGSRAHIREKNSGLEEVSYFDGGVILKKGSAHITIYLSKSGAL